MERSHTWIISGIRPLPPERSFLWPYVIQISYIFGRMWSVQWGRCNSKCMHLDTVDFSILLSIYIGYCTDKTRSNIKGLTFDSTPMISLEKYKALFLFTCCLIVGFFSNHLQFLSWPRCLFSRFPSLKVITFFQFSQYGRIRMGKMRAMCLGKRKSWLF